MTLPDAQLTELRALLQKCSAHIVGARGGAGTGFFIDDRLLLTCAHVVQAEAGTEVDVTPRVGGARRGTVLKVMPEDADDLALVELRASDEEAAQPAVVLDSQLSDGSAYYAVGFPQEKIVGNVGIEEIALVGHRRAHLDEQRGAILLVFDAGKGRIAPGLSGGPVLSSVTGAVTALVQYTNDEIGDAGGAAIPIARAAAAFEEVRTLVEQPPVAARPWRDLLGQTGWLALGKPWTWHRRFDVTVSGTHRSWRVAVEPGGVQEREVTAGDLPPELSLALFYWAQLRLPTRQEDVQLVGKLLASAVFSDAVASRFSREMQADDLILRLLVASDSSLYEVPWEFMTAPWDPEQKPIAAGRTTNLVRVATHAAPESVSLVAATGEAHVLGIVVAPQDFEEAMPRSIAGHAVKWPVKASEQLQQAIDTSPLRLRLLAHPTVSALDEAVEHPDPSRPVEVVHYIGFGRADGDGGRIALLDPDGDAAWHPAKEFLQQVVQIGARLLVAQFITPPTNEDWQPIEPRAFLAALDGRLNAVVFNRVPIYVGRASWFNKELYQSIGQGETVETAVREARRRLYRNPPPEDPASFAWYTVLTGPQSDMQILPTAARSPLETGTKADSPAGASTADESQPAAAPAIRLGGRDALTR